MAKSKSKPAKSSHRASPSAKSRGEDGSQNSGESTFPIVGVGASAGGLEAFIALLKSLPPKPGMAFVMVPHLDPSHESAMTELLSRATKLPVLQVEHGMGVKRDPVYVIQTNVEMT